MDQLARQLERVNPNKKSLSSPLLSARWKLLYTTSESILGTNKPLFLRPQGPIYQTIGKHEFCVWHLQHIYVNIFNLVLSLISLSGFMSHADAVNLRAKNQETWPFFNQVEYWHLDVLSRIRL